MSFVTRYPPPFSSGPTFSMVFLLLQGTCRSFRSVLHISHQIQLQMDCGFPYILRECVCIPPGLPVLLPPLVRFFFMFNFVEAHPCRPFQPFSFIGSEYLPFLYCFSLTLLWSSYSSFWRPSRAQSSLHFNVSFSCLTQFCCPLFWVSFYSNVLRPCLLPRLRSATFHRGLFSKAHPQICLLCLVLC